MAAALSCGGDMPWFAVIVGAGMPSVWSRLKTFAHPDNRNASGPAVLAQHFLPSFVPLFEDLVIDDRRGFLSLRDVAAKVERLP